MNRLFSLACLALISVAVAGLQGCSKSSVPTGGTTAPAPTTAASTAPPLPVEPTSAQPRLSTMKLWVGSQVLVTELALTQEQEMTGMMFRTNIGPNEAMLFVFPRPLQASFWMKNTLIPLSAAYISPNGTILELHDFKPQDTNSVVAATDNIQYVLEAPKDWFKTNNISVGAVVTTENGPFQQVFVAR